MDASMSESVLSTTTTTISHRGTSRRPAYKSCIRVDGRPILPPVMTQGKRRQMNHYKQLAIALEEKKKGKMSRTFPIDPPSPVSIIPIPPPATASIIPIPPASSIPIPPATIIPISVPDNPMPMPVQITTSSEEPDILHVEPKTDLQEPTAKYDDHFAIRKPYYFSPEPADTKVKTIHSVPIPFPLSSPPPRTDEPEISSNKVKPTKYFEESDDAEEHSFSSLPSSTATFIISHADADAENEDNETVTNSNRKSKSHLSSEQNLSEGEIGDCDSQGSEDEWSNLNTSFASATSPTATTTSETQTSMGRVGLAQLHSRLKEFSPSFYKLPEGMSPLLKGVIFSEPLNRREVFRIPPKAYDPSMAPKFERLTATAKGYLVRRLLRTEKVQNIIQTIRDTVELLLKMYDEAPTNSKGETQIKSEDKDLNQRLLQQLHAACNSFHNVFFKLSNKERMAIISTDRNKIRAKALKGAFGGDLRTRTQQEALANARKTVSKATAKSMQRRITMSNPQLQQLRTPRGIGVQRAKTAIMSLGRPAPGTRPPSAPTGTTFSIPIRTVSTYGRNSMLKSKPSRESLSNTVGAGNRTNTISRSTSNINVINNNFIPTPPKKRTGISKATVKVLERRSTLTRGWK